MPIAYLQGNRTLKVFVTFFVGCAVAVSAKGAAIITYVFCLLSAMIISNFAKGHYLKNNLKMMFIFVSVFLIAPIVNEYILSLANFDWGTRLVNLVDSGGSGRLDIWGIIITEQCSSNFIEWIIGHGYNATLKYTYGYTAHNDFIEVLFDYGIVGFTLYVGIIYRLAVYAKEAVKSQKELAAAIGMMFAVFLTLSMMSHMIIYPVMMINVAIFLGLCDGKIQGEN